MIDSPSKRLRAARIKRNFVTGADAARAFGWNETTYKSHENGTRSFIKDVEKYAKAFHVKAGWLMFNEDPPTWYTTGKEVLHRVSIVNMREIPVLRYTELLGIFENKLNIADIMKNRDFMDIPVDPDLSDKCYGLQIDFDTDNNREYNRINKGDLIAVDLKAKWDYGDHVAASIGGASPEIFYIYNSVNSTGQPATYLHNVKPGHQPFEMESTSVEIIGRIVYRLEKF